MYQFPYLDLISNVRHKFKMWANIQLNIWNWVVQFFVQMNSHQCLLCQLVFPFFLFFLLERERAQVGERGRGRGRESQAGSMLSTESNMGLDTTNYKIMTWVEIRSQTQPTEPPRHPTISVLEMTRWVLESFNELAIVTHVVNNRAIDSN